MENNPLLTICIPSYNSQKTIKKTLDSILLQTYPNFEVVFSDNNSTDKTIEIVESFKNPKITIRKNKLYEDQKKYPYLGCYDNYNGCIQSGLIKGTFVAFWHSDDIYKKEMAQKQVEFLIKNPEVGAVFTMATTINQYDKVVGERKLSNNLKEMHKQIYNFEDIFKEIIYSGNTFLITPTFMTRTSIFKELGEFSSEKDFGTSCDLEMWLRIAKKYPIAIIDEKLILHRVGGGSRSYLKSRSKQADFFCVIDYYLKDSATVEENYLNQYEYQKDFDNTLRAVNFLVKGNVSEAAKLVSNPFSGNLLSAFFENPSILRAKVLFLKFVLFLGINLGFGKYLGKLLNKVF